MSGTAAQLQFYGQETARQRDQQQLRQAQATIRELQRAVADHQAQQVCLLTGPTLQLSDSCPQSQHLSELPRRLSTALRRRPGSAR